MKCTECGNVIQESGYYIDLCSTCNTFARMEDLKSYAEKAVDDAWETNRG